MTGEWQLKAREEGLTDVEYYSKNMSPEVLMKRIDELKDSYADILNQLTEMMLLCSENFKTLFDQQSIIMKKLENL